MPRDTIEFTGFSTIDEFVIQAQSTRPSAVSSSLARAAAHSFQVKCPCSESFTASANARACQGSANTGSPSSRGSRGSAWRRSGSKLDSGALKVVVPHVEIHGIAPRGLLPPQLARGEPHRVQVLRLLAEGIGVGVRVDVDAMVQLDRA
jgi:hypothetical protein